MRLPNDKQKFCLWVFLRFGQLHIERTTSEVVGMFRKSSVKYSGTAA